MFNFSKNGKGNDFGGGFFGGDSVQTNTKIITKDNTINGKNVEYWFDYAQGMTERARGLSEEGAEAARIAAERKAIDAGLRAVIRYLLAELRKTQPNHPLLEKKNRDRIFEEFSKQEMDRILKSGNIAEVWKPLERPNEHHTE